MGISKKETIWCELVLEVRTNWADVFSCMLFEQGAQGIHVQEENAQQTLFAAFFCLSAGEGVQGILDRITETWLRQVPSGGKKAWKKMSANVLPAQDWTVEWRKDYRPIPIGKTFLIQPSWLVLPQGEKRVPIVMDPENAFGSGTHASTQLCLMGIEEYHQPGQRVLDVGCGSGVLAIATALREKAKRRQPPEKRRIWAIEPDSDAIVTARKNARRNRVNSWIAFHCKALEDFHAKPFSLIVANLTALDLQNMAQVLCRMCSAKGVLLLSGIENRDVLPVSEVFRRLGFRRIKVRTSQGWSLLVLQKCPINPPCIDWMRRLGPFLGLAMVLLIFSILSEDPSRYLSLRNFRDVASQTVIVAIGALGMTYDNHQWRYRSFSWIGDSPDWGGNRFSHSIRILADYCLGLGYPDRRSGGDDYWDIDYALESSSIRHNPGNDGHDTWNAPSG